MTNVYTLGTRDESLPLTDRANAAIQAMHASDYAFLWLTGEISREAMADLLVAGIFSVIGRSAAARLDDLPTHLALSGTLVHVLQYSDSEAQSVALAPICVKHACGIPLRVYAPQLETLVALSESPIETRLAVHLADQRFPFITAQHPIETDAGKFRADFLVESEDHSVRLVVEADGHNFHERTKEQAARDKSRDRAMLAAGYRVMRFAGSEIWKDPSRCANEVSAVLRGTR